MSEANNPNNQSLDEQIHPLPASEDGQMLENNAQQTQPEPTVQEVSSTIASSNLVGDHSVATSMTLPKQADEADWFTLIKKLRQRNRSLLKQVAQLEQSLAESQQTWQSHQARSQAQETLFVQQKEELSSAQEQLARLFHELESSHQAAQRQQILVETLSNQLDSSQERVAQLERECTLTQQRNNEQARELLQTENMCQELQTRLQRQQRQTLQFKAALEKCLEVPALNYEAKAEPSTSALSQHHLKSVLAAQSLVSKAHPIQPWSAEPDLLEESAETGREGDRERGRQGEGETGRGGDSKLSTPSLFNSKLSQADTEWEPLEEISHTESISAPEANQLTDSITEMGDPEEESEQLEIADIPDLSWMLQMLNESEQGLPPEAAIEYKQPSELPVVNYDNSNTYLNESQEFSLAEDTGEMEDQMDTWGTDSPESAAAPELFESQDSLLSPPNWPSPVVYPLRPPKKLKSLAAIDLPSFPRYRPS